MWIREIVRNKLIVDRIILTVLVLVVISLSGAAYARNMVWQDEVKLWEDVVKKSTNKPRAIYNRHESQGRAYLKQGLFADALGEFQAALKIKADFADPHKNLGYTYLKIGNFDKALEEYQTAVKYEPYSFEIRFNMGNVYSNMKKSKEAIREYQLALRLDPHSAETRQKLEILLSTNAR